MTQQQTDLFRLMAQGLDNAAIAERLGVTRAAAKLRVHRLRQATGIKRVVTYSATTEARKPPPHPWGYECQPFECIVCHRPGYSGSRTQAKTHPGACRRQHEAQRHAKLIAKKRKKEAATHVPETQL